MQKKHGNSSDIVYSAILEDMRRGVILPGDKMVAETLGQHYDVSRTVIREVLARLEQNNIVERTVNAGCRMRIISLRELCDMYEIREAMERLAVEKLTRRGASPEILARLRQYSDIWQSTEDPIVRECADRDFHHLICDSCGSDVLRKVAIDNYVLFNVFNISRYFLAMRQFKKRSKSPNQEHHEIVEAIAAGDAKLAGQRIARHISNARKRIEQLI